MGQKNKIALLSLIILVGFFVAVIFHYIAGTYFKHDDWNSFLERPPHAVAFEDLFIVEYVARTLNPYNNSVSYFPFSYIVTYPFGWYGRFMSAAIFSFIFIAGLFRLNHHFIGQHQENFFKQIQTTFIFTFLTYPALYSFERGNLENLITIMTAVFLLYYLDKKYILGAVILGLAAAMKGYVGIFVFLFILDKRWKETLITCVTTALATIISLLIFQDKLTVQFANIVRHFTDLKNMIIGWVVVLPNDSSLFGFFNSHLSVENHDSLLIYYSAGAALFLLLSIGILFFCQEKVLWKKVAVLTSCSLLLPQMSFDYHMVRIYFPLWLFINYNYNSKNTVKMDYFYTIIFAILLIPKKYCSIFGDPTSHVLSSAALLALLLAVLTESIKNKLKKQNQQTISV